MANGAPRCHPANRPFHDRLEKLRLDCGCKGYYSQEKTYSRALQAVRRYPLPLRSTHEVADLDGMGKACARIFEEIRQKQEPVGQEAEDEWRKCAKQRLLKALSSKAKVSRREAKGLKPQSSVAQPKSGRPRGRGGKGRGGRGKGRGKGGGKTWGKGRSKCSKGSEGSGGAADRHADIEEDDQPLSQLLNPSTPDRSQSSKPFVALTPPSRAHQATPATSPEPTQVASQRSWLEIPEPLTPTLVMRSPLTGGCELLASALASAPASQDSQSGELHVEPVNLGDEGAPSTKKPPVRNLRRAASATEGPKPKRALVQTREHLEPRRPKDPKWRAQHGDLRADLGPMYPIINICYPDGAAAVQCQADGAGVATYPSGRKAVCVLPHHQSRRFSALIYARSEIHVRSAVPDELRPAHQPPHPDDAKRRRTRHLGALDEWGLGLLESLPDGAGGRGSYEVTASHVTVSAAGSRVRVSRKLGAMGENEALSLRLTPELVASYHAATGTTILDFSCDGVSYSFHIGEVWKLGDRGLKATHPLEVSEQIVLASQKSLDNSQTLVETTSNLQKTLKTSASCPSLGDKTLKKSSSESSMRLPLNAFRELSEGRLDFREEHHLKMLTGKVHPSLARPKITKTMREGYVWPAAHPGKPPVEPLQIAQPVSLEKIKCAEVEQRAASMESGQMLAVLVVASWSKQSHYSSSAHAEIVAQAAFSELKAAGEGRLVFCVADLSEAGAIHSSTKFENPLVVNYGVKEAPWLLLFARGDLILSENPHAPNTGGLGFAARLRYKAFALPQVLVVEPAPAAAAIQQNAAAVAQESNGRLKGTQNVVNNFQLQLQTQEVLKRAGYNYELAINGSDALRLASCAQPPYGLLLCSSQVGATAFTELAARMRQRNKKLLAFVCHDAKQLGDFDDAMQNLIRDPEQVAGVIFRPITRTSLQSALRGHPEANVKYPTCGMVKEDIVDLIKRKLSSICSEPEPRHLARLASRKEPLELRSFSVPGKLVLLLDHREVGASKEHALKGAMLSELQKRLGVEAVEARVLPLGDVLWIWRNEKGEACQTGSFSVDCAGWVRPRLWAALGHVSYEDFAERTKKHGQR
ncbi:Protein yippee-like 5, partial [Durusdinium trenchii]